jgi:hypothetical protein
MKIKQILAVLTILSAAFFTSTSRAQSYIFAVNSGTWGDTNVWGGGIAPGPNDEADIPQDITVMVETNVTVQDINDYGTLVMAPNSTLTLLTDMGISSQITLNATATSNTVTYVANPFYAVRQTNYFNLVLVSTNYVESLPPFGSPWQFFNNFSSPQGPTPMTIAGDMTLVGSIEVQQGTDSPGVSSDISIGGNLIIGPGCAWDTSGANLTVAGDTYILGLFQDLNGALGSNYFGGNVIVAGPSTSVKTWSGGVYTNGWYVSDVTAWGVGGGLTNNGATFGSGYGSISFNGAGTIAGTNVLTIPTMTVNGTYTIANNITVTTNTPSFNGTLIFDLANTDKIIQQYVTSTNQLPSYTNMYFGGNLVVINSGGAPVSGNVYQLFSAHSYAGGFATTSFPNLPAGLSWVDSTLTNGSITVVGGSVGSPKLAQSRNGGILTLSWDSATYPGYSVQGQTNSAGLHSNWGATGSGTTSPFMIAINPANPPVFFRLSKP